MNGGNSPKPAVLVFLARYLPGVKAGGPLRSIAGLVEALGDEVDFRIVTMDRDKDDEQHYPGIQPDRWTKVGKAEVLYLSPARLGFASISRLIMAEKADVLYLNSFFNRHFSIFVLLARVLGARAQKALVLAPRGEFGPGALGLHRRRKRVYVELAKRLPIYNNLCWHASSEREERDIRGEFGPRVRVKVALPISLSVSAAVSPDGCRKSPGKLRIAFLARIAPMKNLLQAVQMLHGISGDIEFNIYGPQEDTDYWRQCEDEIARLPPNIRTRALGLVPHSAVSAIFAEHHLFYLPTLGENYGHGIFDALNSGCPVLISDRTPWRGLEEANAGWDLPLDQPESFRQALAKCVAMDDAQFRAASISALAYVRRFTADANLRAANRALFVEDEKPASKALPCAQVEQIQ